MFYSPISRVGLRSIRKPALSSMYSTSQSERVLLPRSLARLWAPDKIGVASKRMTFFTTLSCRQNEHKTPSHSNKTNSQNTNGNSSSADSPTTNSHCHEHASNEHSHSHSHEHSHSHSLFGHTHTHSPADSVFVQEKGGLRNPAIRITWIGLLVNLSMAVGKGIGGVVFHSQALLADAIHALSDLVSDFLTLATVSVASSPPSKFFPNGYGKIETLGSLGVSALLILAGVSVGWSGLISLAQQLLGDSHIVQILISFFGHGHSHSHVGGAEAGHSHVGESQMVDLNAMWLALASIGVKEWLFRATMKVANKTGSTVLVANAWHHRVDSLTSIVAVCTIGGSYALGLSWLDAFGGLLVSSVIIQAGLKNGKAAALELADNTSIINTELIGTHREHVESILAQHVAESHGNILPTDFSIANLTLLPSGPNFLTEVELGLSRPNLPTASAVSTAAYVERELLKRDPRVKRAIVTITTDNKSQN